jgi:hypothetical protein
MSYKAIIKNKSDIPEGLEKEYVEREGIFYLDVEEVDGFKLDNPQALKNTITAVRTERDAFQTSLKTFEGIEDPAAAMAAVAKIKELGDLDGLDIDEKIKAGIEEHKTQLTTKFENDRLKLETKSKDDMTAADSKYESLFGQYREQAVKNDALRILSELGGNAKLLMPMIQQRARVNMTEDGAYGIQIIGDDGNPVMTKVPGKTDDMTLKEYVTGLRNDSNLAAAFSGDGASGSGSTPSPSGGKTPSASGSANVPVRMTSAEASDLNNYKRISEAAAKEGRSVEIVD